LLRFTLTALPIAFYLIMNVAVGGTNGWFPDDVGNKPWVDQSSSAMRDFAFHQNDWFSTWPQDIKQRAMVVCVLMLYRYERGS
jgi:hypothetical protein